MNKLKRLLASVGLAAALAVVVACGGVDSGTQTNGGTAVSAALPTTSQMESKAASAQSSSAQSGIWVTGEGTLTVEPDLVLLNLGVDSRGETVTEANDKATAAMDAMVGALRARTWRTRTSRRIASASTRSTITGKRRWTASARARRCW